MTVNSGPSNCKIHPLVAGNWKMNGLSAQLSEASRIAEALSGPAGAGCDAMICPPTTLVRTMAELVANTPLRVGAQDCHDRVSGAHTGDISAPMLKDAGAVAVIVGHSERRADHSETDAIVRAKATAAHRAGIAAIVCVGETSGQRRAGLTLEVVRRQLIGSVPDDAASANTIIAYEPVWAIGTGLTPTLAQVGEAHSAIRQALEVRFGEGGARMRILYGGSVNPGNAKELLAVAHVNGALVGGASLKAADFMAIVAACGD